MALRWELSAIDNWQTRCLRPDGNVEGVTECLIWALMFVGIPNVDAANLRTVCRRIRMWETANGPISTRGTPLEGHEIRDRIGLRTNASSMTEAAFRKKLGQIMAERAEREMEG